MTIYSPLSPVFTRASSILNFILFCVPESRLNETALAVIVWYAVVPSLPVQLAESQPLHYEPPSVKYL
ncbi:hypothetical protein DRO03_09865 [Methanosarcinales archaeon]|nr:MAG: hypothetical protein DRO03_09865 [Methanosarcinales archaeon]